MLPRNHPFFPASHLLLLASLHALPRSVQAQPGTSLYTIPVVFHVLHQNGTENIPDLQILDAIAILNEHFDAPTQAIDPPFDSVVGDMDIAFVLANTAPDGSPTDGIDRIETPLTENAGAPESYLNPWPRNRYLNIWTVASLDAWGVAYLTARPEAVANTPCTDGIMIFSNYVGSIGTSGIVQMRTLTQAVGRFLNLKMLHEDPIDDGPCGDDEVADTPPCPLISFCDAANEQCSTMPANVENFMMFSYCQKMFTEGQRARVHACINSSVAQRDELVGGTSTGTYDCTTAISDRSSGRGVTAYPNPFTDRIVLLHPPPGTFSARLNDLSGRTVAAFDRISSGHLHVNPALTPGCYVLLVQDSQGVTSLSVMKE